jgi:hypothetical protein
VDFHAKCAADIMHDGNPHMQLRKALNMRCYLCWFPGTVPKLKRPVQYFLYLSAHFSFITTDSFSSRSSPGETENAEKNLREERGYERRRFHLQRVGYTYLE